MRLPTLAFAALLGQGAFVNALAIRRQDESPGPGRERVLINDGWRFQRFEENPDGLSYEKLKPWILPSANKFIQDTDKRKTRPKCGDPRNVTYAQVEFDDEDWEQLDLPHDWAIEGPFYKGEDSLVSGGMGRLPSHGVGWYRRTIQGDDSKSTFLDISGAMSYATVWVNGVIVGGWPYGYASFRLDLTPYLDAGDNQLAIRLDNELENSRWYPGAGIYRDVWLTKVRKVHVGQDGTFITAEDISSEEATLNIVVQLENALAKGDKADVRVETEVLEYDAKAAAAGTKVAEFPGQTVTVEQGIIDSLEVSTRIQNPKLWGPVPQQKPNLYVAITRVFLDDEEIDSYETTFGIRNIEYKGDGLFINGERIYIQGVCQHHDLGSLGAAFNIHAAERQLQMLQDMGSNSIRTSHNVPDPALPGLADKMGMIILDEIFDTWTYHKTPNDFQTIFADWSEPDLRAFIRRDRNHPSVWAWSYGNEVQEQNEDDGEEVAKRLRDIVREEDSTRLSTLGMNNAGPDTPFISVVDMIGLNYQGEGKGYGDPAFQQFHDNFPDKLLFSTESSSVVSSRGTYFFPVTSRNSEIVDADGVGTDPDTQQVSSYELYAVPWGASPDKVFAGQDAHPYVAGEYVWTGWDYLGEPTPYDSSRSSYFGIIDLAGFPKDRFYLYQARWNPDVRMAHILPHWNWPDREGEVTPVHVFSSADEAELFVNGESQGRQAQGNLEYRFRWDKVRYEPGEVRVVTYKAGEEWAEETIRTTGPPAALKMTTYQDRSSIASDGQDLLFVSVSVVDEDGDVVPDATDSVSFSVDGPGAVLTTDNGDQTDFNVFQETEREAFSGKVMAIVRADTGASGSFTVRAKAVGLEAGEVTISVQ